MIRRCNPPLRLSAAMFATALTLPGFSPIRVNAAPLVQPGALRVRIMNEAHVAKAILSEALAETNRIYGRIGIEVVWSERDGSHPALFIKLIKASIDALEREHPLGVTPGTSTQPRRHAWVFYGPIRDRAAALTVRPGVLMGAVIAHELGHLLLPESSHRSSGLMRHEWDAQQVLRAMRGQLTFTGSQAALIQARVRDSAGEYAD